MDLREVNISLTDACNSRCIMCGIWERQDTKEFDRSFLSQLPRSLKSINLAGGEPFLRRDLLVIVQGLKDACPFARVVISTNGFLTELIIEDVEEILKIEPKIAIRISLDGIEKVHDRIRGYPGAYNCAMITLRGLKKIGVKDLGINITVINENIMHLNEVYDLSKTMGVKFNCQIAHSSDFYFRKDNEEIIDKNLFRNHLNQIMGKELKGFGPYRLFKVYYYKGIWDYVNHFPRTYRCLAGNLFCYIDSRGDIYPCIMLEEKMGSLKENSFLEIWKSCSADLVREKVKKCNRNCWLICTSAPAIKNSPYKALPWILKNKAKAHLGCKIV